tara:strand:+ start:4586 stop:4852 length:267 start_codon:yes stop_codon:yes gene_type:complete
MRYTKESVSRLGRHDKVAAYLEYNTTSGSNRRLTGQIPGPSGPSNSSQRALHNDWKLALNTWEESLPSEREASRRNDRPQKKRYAKSR